MNNDAPLPDDLPPAAVDGSQCSQHPYRPNLGGGICASCLKEKLGKLVSSSSFPLPLHRPSSSSSSAASSPPSSDLSSSSSSSKPPNLVYDRSHSRRAKILSFLYSKKKKNRKYHSPSPAVPDRAAELALRRSNTAPKRPEHIGRFLDGGDILEYSPRKKGFWSFLYLSAGNHQSASASRQHHCAPNNSATSSSSTSAVRADRTMPFSNDVSKMCSEVIPEYDDVDSVACEGNNFERKVSRSRSVGCGSRSFSGDLFERISTGFGDCTFRRAESLRETDCHGHGHTRHRFSSADTDHRMKERVKRGSIFGGFMMASSSLFLSSSSYLISTSSSEGHLHRGANGVRSAVPAVDGGLHGRSRIWGGWVFASPMRAFGRPSSSKEVKSCNATPKLNAIPSLLTVGG